MPIKLYLYKQPEGPCSLWVVVCPLPCSAALSGVTGVMTEMCLPAFSNDGATKPCALFKWEQLRCGLCSRGLEFCILFHLTVNSHRQLTATILDSAVIWRSGSGSQAGRFVSLCLTKWEHVLHAVLYLGVCVCFPPT